MAVVTEMRAKEAAQVVQVNDSEYVSDNGQVRVTLTRNPTAATFEAGGRFLRGVPRSVKYIDPITGMDDVLYEASNADVFVQRGFHVWLDSSFPSVDEQFIVEAGALKHNITLRGGLRDPLPFLEEPWLAVTWEYEYDPALSIEVDEGTPDERFSTAGGVSIVDRAGNPVFDLPAVLAWDQNDSEMVGRYEGEVIEPGRMELMTCVPVAWLADSARVYPVIIDPTTVSTNTTSYNQTNEVHRTNEGVRVVFMSEGGDLRNQYAFFSLDKGQTWTKQAIPASPMDNSTSAKTARAMRAAYDASRGLFWLVHFGLQTYAYTSARWNATTNQFEFGAWRQPPSSSYYWSTLSDGGAADIAVSPAGEIVLAYVYTTSATTGYSRCQIITATGATAFDAAWTYVSKSAYLNTSTTAFVCNCQVEHDPHNNKFWVVGGIGDDLFIYLLKSLTVSSSANIQAEEVTSYASPVGFIILDANRMLILGKWSSNQLLVVLRTGGAAAGTYGTRYYGTYTMRSSPTNYTSNAHLCKIGDQARLYFIDADAALVEVKISNLGEEQSRRVIATGGTANADSLIAPFGERNTESDLSLMWAKSLSAPNTYYHELIADNRPPLAPSNIVRSNFDATQAAEVTYQYNDPDAGDGLTAHEVEIYDTADPATRVWHLPKTGTTTAVFTIPAYTLQDGRSYQMRIRTYDKAGLESPWSTWAMFKCSTPPLVTISAPGDGSTIASDEFTFSGSYVHPSGLTQKTFRFKLYDALGTTLIQDSGEIVGNTNLYTFRDLANNTTYTVEFIATSQEDVSSSALVTFSVRYTPPATPTVSVANDPMRARVAVEFNNPVPSADQPAADRNDVYRREIGSADWKLVQRDAASPFVDPACPAGEFEYGVIAVSAEGALSDRGVATVTSHFYGQWIVDETNPDASVAFVFNESGGAITYEDNAQVSHTFGDFPRVRGAMPHHTSTLAALYIDGQDEVTVRQQVNRLKEMVDSESLYLLKMEHGENFRVKLHGLNYHPTMGGKISDVSVRWTEVDDV